MNTPALLKEIEQLHTKTLQNTIDLLNQKQLWKIRACQLARQNKQCCFCLSKQDWNPETLTCQKCHRKEVAHV